MTSRPHLALVFVALVGCGGASTSTATNGAPPFPRPTAPGLYGDAGATPGTISPTSSSNPWSPQMSTASPTAKEPDVFSTHRDGEQDLAAITGGSASATAIAPNADPGDPGEVVSRMQPAFRDCFDKTLKTEPKAGGSVTLDVLLLPTGAVKSITPKNNAGLSQTVVKCATGVVEKARFRPPEGGAETHIEIPLKFRPRS